MSNQTTIKLDTAVRESLKELKIHPRQSYSDVIKQIIKGEPKPVKDQAEASYSK